ncbi:tyrosine-type recombinase/integrase [Desulforhopalus singaporensis]|uniref:Site-specific recombinase XerD n=1 Tax=Desulforhopalus singaporensis TaxID=91360 RepID=A0A1H0VCH0_9BACT|nr:site-specific integrase [Desulforhopalus singaporensis]SDP76041.1 Site-specific recombinase XerD [Desulforhopalus singaporensis]
MPSKKRVKTNYPGVYYIEGKSADRKRVEKIFYIMYRKNGKLIEEKAGRQFQDDMTPARAAGVRALRIEGKQQTNTEKRQESKKNPWTIEKLWEQYKEQRPGGVNKTDQSFWSVHLKDSFGSKEPAQLVKLDTDRLRINLLKKRSPQTVKHVLALLRRIINYGVDQGLVTPLPFKITLPSVDNIKTEDLSPEQLEQLLVVLETTHRIAAANMMKLALFSGMRRGEIFKLKWDDIDFHRGFIHIQEPKGGKSQKIPLNNNARELLESIEPQESEYIFPARGGGPRKDISKDARKIKEAAGLPADFRPFHGLRHVYATMLASSGKVDMYTLQKLMTHKSPQMTQRYAHHRDEALRRAADEVENILNDAMKVTGKKNVA